MAYTKPDQAPFAAKLDASINEFVVQLSDTSNYVAVSCVATLMNDLGNPLMSGNPVFKAKARVVNADGTPMLDNNGNPIESYFSQTSNPTEIESLGGAGGMQKQCLLAVLGEATTTWNDPIHSTQMQNASIRNTLASVPHIGPAPTSTLL